MLPAWEPIQETVKRFLEAGFSASAALASMLVAVNGAAGDARAGIASRAFERILQCVLATMDKHPLGFARLLPPFLTFYGHTALMAMDAAALASMRAKARVLLTRFLARALLCPYYRQDWVDAQAGGVLRASTKHACRLCSSI